jgi:hypothetical protein
MRIQHVDGPAVVRQTNLLAQDSTAGIHGIFLALDRRWIVGSEAHQALGGSVLKNCQTSVVACGSFGRGVGSVNPNQA